MSKISKDNTSWHASGVIVRDERHDKSSSEVPKNRSKKDTKKWCLGKVGREHDKIWEEDTRCYSSYARLLCIKCRKEFDMKYLKINHKLTNENRNLIRVIIEDMNKELKESKKK